MADNKRIAEIDVAKGIGILLVVLGHTHFNEIIISYIYLFHMPLFFFLSGLTMSEDKVENFRKYATRVLKLYVEFVLIELIFLLLHNLLLFYGVIDETTALGIMDILRKTLAILTLGGGETLVGPLWFLIALIWIYIVFYFMYRILKLKNKAVLVIFSIILYCVGWNIKLPRTLSQALIGYLYFCIAFVLFNSELKKLLQKLLNNVMLNVVLLPLEFVIMGIVGAGFDCSIAELRCGSIMRYLVVSTLGILIVLQISCLFCKSQCVRKVFTVVGRNSLIIMALHLSVFKVVMLVEKYVYCLDRSVLKAFPIYLCNIYWLPIFVLCAVVIPIIFQRTIDISKNAMKKLFR